MAPSHAVLFRKAACFLLPALGMMLACGGGGGASGGGGAALSITAQPVPATAVAPEGAVFTVKAAGATSYQWRKDGQPITGATAESYAVPATDLQATRATFSVVVTGGGQSVTSQDATLTVQAPSPTWAGDPVAMPARPLTVLASPRAEAAFPNGSFRLGYDEALKNPVWTAYAAFKVGTTFPNSNRDFQTDTRLMEPRVADGDYGSHGGLFYREDRSGYDRGHMVTMSDISYRYGSQAGEDATLMSNIVPQVSSFNQGLWSRLERAIGGSLSGGAFTDGLPGLFGRVWVYTGPVFTGKTTYWVPSENRFTQDAASLPAATLRIAMPTGCWKVLVAHPASGTPKALAVLMPNVHGLPDDAARIKDFVTSVARVEELTGLNLFPNAPTSIPNLATWKATVDVRGWGSTFEQATGPNVAALQPSWDLTVKVGDTVAFQGTAAPASAGGTVTPDTGCRWTFTNGMAPATGLTASRTFTTAGTYTATFTATDSLGASNTVSRTIRVLGDNTPPAFQPDVLPDLATSSGVPAFQTFTLSDDRTSGAEIGLTAASSNPTLLPDAGIAVTSRLGGAVGLTLTPTKDQTGTATVTLTATDADGLKTLRSFQLTVTASMGATMVEGFEAGNKGSYSLGDAPCDAGTWSMNDALVGTLTADAKVGAKSVRIRNSGTLTMKFDWTKGANTVSVKHAKYGSDSPSTWELWQSTDGGSTWTRVGSAVSTTGTALETATFSPGTKGAVRFEVRKTDGTSARLNLDVFQIVGD